MSNARTLSKIVVGTEIKIASVDSDLSNKIVSIKGRLDSDDSKIQSLDTALASVSAASGMADSDLKVVGDLRNQLDSEMLFVRNLALSYTSFLYNATAGQTSFSGSDANSATLYYTAGAIQVFLNGVFLTDEDYTATDGTTIVLTEPAQVSAQLIIVCPKLESNYTAATPSTQVENSRYTALLISADSESGNSIITDASSNNHTITVNGDAAAGTFSPYRHGGYSLNFSTANDRIQVAEDTTTRVLGNDFTVEGWVYVTGGNSGLRTIIAQGKSGVYSPFNVYYDSSVSKFKIDLSSSGSSWDIASQVASSSTYSENAWHHWALVRDGTAFKLYVNGSLDSTIATSSATLMTPTRSTSLGAREDATYDFYGYMRDVRLVIGTAVYSGSSYTVPTEPLEDITNTKLLLCALPYIADKSSNSLTVNGLGDVLSEILSPYDHGRYSASDNGGSIYFDGNGDYLTPASNVIDFGSSDQFTVEFWVYFTDLAGTSHDMILGSTSSNNYIGYKSTTNQWELIGASNTFFNYTHVNDQWYHVVIQRNNSSLVTMFINGQSISGTTITNNSAFQNTHIGRCGAYTTHDFQGYMSDIKITKGSVLYTTNFTPPTSPTSSSGATLHIKGTDASIIDKAQGTNLVLPNSGVTGSTTQVKFASTKSIYFDGTSSAGVPIGTNLFLDAINTEYTLEMWYYPTQTGTNSFLMSSYIDTSTGRWLLYQQGSDSRIRFFANLNGTKEIYTSAVSANTWYHVAVVRKSNGYMSIFLNGTETELTTDVSGYATVLDRPVLLGSGDTFASNGCQGYIQDVRITKGLVRYTGNYTPPTAPLEG